MGFIIERYSISELNRISAPNKVVPALFWLIPVGQWKPEEVKKLWNHFTQVHDDSLCEKLGLMLVKNSNYLNDNGNTNNQTTDLSDLTGILSELLPAGIKSIYDNDYFALTNKKSQILILSGSYPQPGWGVLLTVFDYHTIESLIHCALKKTDPNIEKVFITASNSYLNWNSLKRERPIKEDSEKLKKNQTLYIEIFLILAKLLEGLSQNSYNNTYFELLKNAVKNKPLEELSENFNSLFYLTDDKFMLALLILTSNQSTSEDEIYTTLIKFINEHNPKTNNLFICEKNKELKKAAGFLLKLNDLDRPVATFVSWSKKIYESKINVIIEIVNELKLKLESSIGSLSISIENIDSAYKSEMENWKDNLEKIRLKFHKNLQAVLKIHLEKGPTFLLNIEKEGQKHKIDAKTVSWDPPRMVGWKLLIEGLQISTFDLTTILQEMIPDFTSHTSDILINGSLFTDYVHYLALSDTNITTRTRTKELLKKLTLPSDVNKILKKNESIYKPNQSHEEMIENILVAFGWPKEKNNKQNKLAECIIENQGEKVINKSFSGNDIRGIF